MRIGMMNTQSETSSPGVAFRWGSLRARIIAWTFVPTAIILVAVALVTFTAYQQVTEELVVQRDQDLARLSASQLATELAKYTDLLTALARTSEIYQGDPTAQRDALKKASNRLAVFDGGVLILETFGTVVAAEPERPEALGQDWSNRACYLELLRSRMLRSPRPVFSNVVGDGPRGADVVCVAVPITGEQGEFMGIMVGMFRLGAPAGSAFYGDIVKLRIGESGSTYLVDGHGRVIHHSDADRIGEDFSAQPVVQQALSGQVDAIRTRDPEGLDIVASFAPVPGTPWGLVVEESWATLTSGSRGYQQFLLLLLMLGVAAPILVVSAGVRRITRPIVALISAAREVARGSFGQTITARTGDEVEELARQFNRMSAQLQESYAHLEQRVADRTRELATLNAIAATVSQSLDLDEILNDALDKTLQAMDIEAGGIYLLDERAGVLTIVAQRGFNPQAVAEIDGLKVGEGFSGRVAQSGQPLVVRDVSTDPRLTRMVVREEGLRSLAIVSLSSKGRVLGTLFAVTHGYREFTDQDVQLLTSIGHQIGVAIENARLYENTRSRLAQLSALQETTTAVVSTLELDELLNLITQQAATLLQADGGILNLVDWEKDEDEAVATTGSAASAVGRRSPLEGSLSGWTTLHNRPLISNQVQCDSRVDRRGLAWLEGKIEKQIQSAAVAPLTIKDQVVGTLVILDKQGGEGEFDQADLDLLVAFANQAATAIDNARLFEAEQRRAEQFRVIAEVGHQISSILPVNELLTQMARSIQEAFHYSHVGIGLVEGDEVVSAWQDAYQSPRLKVGQEGVWGWVARSGEPLLVPDVSQESRFYPAPHAADVRSQLCVPLKAKEAVIGVLSVESDQPNAFDRSDLAVLQSLANQAAVVIENVRLFEAEQRRAEQFRVVTEVGRHITSILDADELLEEIARLLKEAFGYYLITIGVIEGDEVVFKAGAKTHWPEPQFRPAPVKLGGRGITAWVASTGEPLLVPDVSQEPRYIHWPDAAETRSELAVPLKTKTLVIGVLNVESDRLNAFDESDLEVLQSLANQAAIAIENARLYEQAQQVAIVEERSRLARELHDSVTQSLYSSTLLAEAAQRLARTGDLQHVNDYLARLGEITQQALKEMRLLVYELRPLPLREEGLVGALNQRLDAVERRAGVEARLVVEGELDLPATVEEELYRIAQEALNNALKHAAPTSVTVTIRAGGGRSELEVVDDGEGFDPSAVGDEGGMGLVSMRERAEKLGGTLQLISAPAKGTRVKVSLTTYRSS
jgi:GAF domain-containing protein/HAMP domain-containing protein